jgi:hypothetical protein
MTEGFAGADKSKPYIGLNSLATDRGYKDGQATAICLCGAVQLAFVSLKMHLPYPRHTITLRIILYFLTNSKTTKPTNGPGLVNTFVCNCVDCRKLTASMFASNFAIDDKYLTHVRGRENLKAGSIPSLLLDLILQ